MLQAITLEMWLDYILTEFFEIFKLTYLVRIERKYFVSFHLKIVQYQCHF